jgi:predicted enzyme related to lactoylglutathione lyase
VTFVKLPGILILALTLVSVRAADLPPINATPTGLMLPGKMIWADLYTKNPTDEIQFYTGLFGWTAATIQRPSGATYVVLSSDGQPVAGVVFRDSPKGDTGQGRWISYISVSDVAQTVAAATGLGGRIVHPTKMLPGRGTQAMLTDSEGSLIGVVHSSTGDLDETEPGVGCWAWAHLSARDPAKAAQFYHAVFGEEIVPDTREGRTDSFLLNSQGFTRASIGPIPNRPEATPEWLGFIRVANLDDAIAKATSLGARVLLAPKSTEPESRLAILADPADVAIGLVELSKPRALEVQKP